MLVTPEAQGSSSCLVPHPNHTRRITRPHRRRERLLLLGMLLRLLRPGSRRRRTRASPPARVVHVGDRVAVAYGRRKQVSAAPARTTPRCASSSASPTSAAATAAVLRAMRALPAVQGAQGPRIRPRHRLGPQRRPEGRRRRHVPAAGTGDGTLSYPPTHFPTGRRRSLHACMVNYYVYDCTCSLFVVTCVDCDRSSMW